MVEAVRIGPGWGYFVLGALGLGVGAFVGYFFSSPVGAWIASAAGGLIVIGFWVRLFHLLERRLVDIEAGLKRADPPASS